MTRGAHVLRGRSFRAGPPRRQHGHPWPLRRASPEPGQFGSWAFTQRARASGLLPSMGSIGDCVDNAMMESFWARVHVELLNRRRWRTRLELSTALFEYLEILHNRQRRHSALGMLSSGGVRTPHPASSLKPSNSTPPNSGQSGDSMKLGAPHRRWVVDTDIANCFEAIDHGQHTRSKASAAQTKDFQRTSHRLTRVTPHAPHRDPVGVHPGQRTGEGGGHRQVVQVVGGDFHQ
jgi:Integrase core domain